MPNKKHQLKVALRFPNLEACPQGDFFLSVEFDTPANRVIAQLQPKNQFRIDPTLPDITFLRQLSIQGRLWYEIGNTGISTTDLITRTPPSGTTDFIYNVTFSVSSAGSYTLDLFNDGQSRLKVRLGSAANEARSMSFPIIDSLVGDGTKMYNINVTEVANANASVTLFGWTENTSRIRDVAP